MTLYHRLLNPTTHRPAPAIIMQLAHHRAARDAALYRAEGHQPSYRRSLAQYLRITWAAALAAYNDPWRARSEAYLATNQSPRRLA